MHCREARMRTLRSDVTKRGITRTPHRAFMRAMGLDDAAIEKPMVGIVSMKGEQTPCNMTHGFQVEAAKEGVAESGGTPREFTTISVSDGLSMNHQGMKFSLVSRELIADSIETVVRAHCYDGLVGFAGCDKTLPGVMMAMVRCNVPSVFVYGGSAVPGRWRGRDLRRDLVARDSRENAAAVVAADGGSINAGLQLPAIAHEAGIRFTLDDLAEVWARTPLIADLRPGGTYVAKDVYDIGGVPVI